MDNDYVIRALAADDEPLLWDALYQGLHTPGGEAPPRELMARPDLARYVENWGRAGDRGFVAHDRQTRGLLGAVWYREPLPAADPELVLVVSPGQRKRGIGTALLTQWVRANPEQSEITLRMGGSNPAVRLYERFGFRVVRQDESSVTLRREF